MKHRIEGADDCFPYLGCIEDSYLAGIPDDSNKNMPLDSKYAWIREIRTSVYNLDQQEIYLIPKELAGTANSVPFVLSAERCLMTHLNIT